MAEQKKEMTTLSGVMTRLDERGQGQEFKMTDKGLTFDEIAFYTSSDLKIIKTYRFEGDSNPDDESILYLIETADHKVGYLVEAYGVYSNAEPETYNQFIREIPVEDRDEQQIFS